MTSNKKRHNICDNFVVIEALTRVFFAIGGPDERAECVDAFLVGTTRMS